MTIAPARTMSCAEAPIAAAAFGQAVRSALKRCDFAAPAVGTASVVLCKVSTWQPFADSARDLLSESERTRAARFRSRHDGVTYVLAHALWRTVLARCLDVDPSQLPLESSPEGQPQLPGTGLAISLSHSGDWVAMAICTDIAIGVDIELAPARTAMTELMPMICTPTEHDALNRLSSAEREAALLLLWTRKEALLKAFGTGLHEDPAALSALSDALIEPPTTSTAKVSCRARDLTLPNELVGALAAPASIATVRLHLLGAPDR